MKRILLYCAVLLTFAACERDELEPYPVEKSFEDPNVPLTSFKSQLAAGADGWKATLAPAEGGLFGGYIKFENNGEARMVFDYSNSAANTPFTNKYTLNVTQTVNPTLSLDKTSPFGIFAATANLDTDYTFKSSTGDTLKLLGNTFGSALTLIKVTKAEADEYLAGRIAQAAGTVGTLNTFRLYFKRLTVGSKVYDLIMNTGMKVVTLNYTENGAFKSFTTYFGYTSNGIIFKSPFIDGSTKISSLSNLQVNTTANTATLTAGGAAATIATAATPLTVDLGAAQRFYSDPFGGYWASDFGFTVNGVRNAFNVTAIPGYTEMRFAPRYNVSGTTYYDRLGFIVNTTGTPAYAPYGPAAVPSFTTNGRIIFTNFGSFGTAPTAYATIVNNTRDKLIDAMGYYVIQSGPTSYDLVGARDGATWISFY